MRIIEQSYKILSITDPKLIERAGRVAYKSEDKITEDSYKEFCSKISKNNHGAVLEHSSMSVLFITDRGISHELVRHRIASFTQESTRYCDYSKDKFNGELTFIKPLGFNGDFIKDPDEEGNNTIERLWFAAIYYSAQTYKYLLEEGWKPQMARSVLPNSLKTEIVVTANFREWKHIFQLRAVEKAAHPQMRNLIIPLYLEMKNKYPEIFDLGEVQ